MGSKVPKLPRYVFKRANGSLRYKRNVPNALVRAFGKQTLYRQLGNTLSEAMKQYPVVHAKSVMVEVFKAHVGFEPVV